MRKDQAGSQSPQGPSSLWEQSPQPLSAGTQTTHLVTMPILTPKTPVCLREGILFKLNSRLVNFTDSFTSTYMGQEAEAGVSSAMARTPTPTALLASHLRHSWR